MPRKSMDAVAAVDLEVLGTFQTPRRLICRLTNVANMGSDNER